MRITFLSILMTASASAFSQVTPQLGIYGPDYVESDWTDDPAPELSLGWVITNHGESGVNLQLTREILSSPQEVNLPYVAGGSGVYERFCWGPLCYNYGTSSSSSNSSLTVYIPSGMSNNTFLIDFYPNSVSGSTSIRYCFHTVGNYDDSNCRIATFKHVNPNTGCTNSSAVNFDSTADEDDGSCLFSGCTDELAANFHPANSPSAEDDCIYCDACPGDTNNDGSVSIGDLLLLLTAFGEPCAN